MRRLNQIIKRRSIPGVLIFNSRNQLLYSNKEAMDIIPRLEKKTKIAKSDVYHVPRAIYNICNEVKKNKKSKREGYSNNLNCKIIKSRGEASCSLRAFFVDSYGKERRQGNIVVLIEKIIDKHSLDLEKIALKFRLTKREAEVLMHICCGLSNKEIADILCICECTAKDHTKSIMKKMAVNSKSKMIADLLGKEKF